jgi:hypothetical protein
MSHFLSPLPGLLQLGITVEQQLPGKIGRSHEEHREHINFCVPEIVTLIAFTGQAFGGNIAVCIPACGLQELIQVETNAFLKLPVILDDNVRGLPEIQ